MHSKVVKNQQKEQGNEKKTSLATAIVIPKKLTTEDVHRKIEEFQTELRYTGFPRITKPGAAYELIKLGIISKESTILSKESTI